MQDVYEDDPWDTDMALYKNLLRAHALNVILLDNKEAEESLFDILQLVGDLELLGEMTALSMARGNA